MRLPALTQLRSVRRWLVTSWWGRILAEHDTEPTELGSAFLKVLLGVFLLLPLDTFGSSTVYDFLGLLPEVFWGALLLAVGLLHLAALRTGHWSWRHYMALAGFVVWSCFGISFLLGNRASTGDVVYFLAAVGMGWVYVRLGIRIRRRMLGGLP